MKRSGWLSSSFLFGSCLLACFGAAATCSAQQPERPAQPEQPATSQPPTVLAHYMPWYAARPASDQWGWHWTMNHFDPERQVDGRREVASKFYPVVGPYDSGDRDVLEYHLLLMKTAGIDGVIVDWYGLTDLNDYAVLHRNTTRLLQQCERLKMKFVICYEDQTIPRLVDAKRIDASAAAEHAAQEITWLGKYWFRSPSYLKLGDKPVLLSFGHAGLSNDQWRDCLGRLEFPVAYFSQDFRRDGAVGGFGWPAPHVGLEQVQRFADQSEAWPHRIPAAFPRFDDIYRVAGVSDGYPKIDDDDGKTLASTLEMAFSLGPKMIQIATWNDWGEGTQIEPSHQWGDRDLRIIQDAVRKHGKRGFAFDGESLKVPLAIYRLRTAGEMPADRVDAVVDLVIAGKMDQAKVIVGLD